MWNIDDTYNPDVVIGTESWLKEDISNTKIFRDVFRTFRKYRSARGGGGFVCVLKIKEIINVSTLQMAAVFHQKLCCSSTRINGVISKKNYAS
jgi:hypothetical protein